MSALRLVRDRPRDQPEHDAPVRLLVVGAGAGTLKSTVALNLAVAAAAVGVPTVLCDLDGASSRALASAARAHAGGIALPWLSATLRVRPSGERCDPTDDIRTLTVVDAPARLDDLVREELAAATDVLVPMDASPIARRALREIVAETLADRDALAAAPRLHVVLGRALARDVDRWALLEELETLAPGALLATTLPTGRATRAASLHSGEPVARLYGPATRAAAAYGALVRGLGLAGPSRCTSP